MPVRISVQVFISLFFILPLLLCSCSSPDEKKQAHFQKGMEYSAKGDTKSAIIELRNAIQIDPKFAQARYQLALLYLQQKDLRQGYQELLRVVSLAPENIEALFKTASIQFLANNLDDSKNNVDLLLAKNPEHVEALLLQANIALKKNQPQEASTVIGKAITLDPSMARLYLTKAQIFTARQDLKGAEESFRKAIELEPKNILFHEALVSFYLSLGKPIEAVNHLNTMTQKFPEDQEILLALSSLLEKLNNVSEAEKGYQKAVELKPDKPRTHVALAEFLERRQLFDQAEKSLRYAVTLDPDNLDTRATLADFLFRRGQLDLAREEVKAILAKNPQHAEMKFVQAKILITENKPRESMVLLNELLTAFPRRGDLHYQTAVAHSLLGEGNQAMQAINNALLYAPESTEIRFFKAQLLLGTSEFKPAAIEATEVLRLQPNHFPAAMLVGNSYLYRNEHQIALQIFEELRKSHPDNTSLLVSIGVCKLSLGHTEEAIPLFEKALSININENQALSYLTMIQLKEGNINQAIARVQQQINSVPDNGMYYLILGKLFYAGNSFSEALRTFRKTAQIKPDSLIAHEMIAKSLIKLGKRDEAIKEYWALIEKRDNFIPAYMGLATLLQENNQQEAKGLYEKVLTIDPKNAMAANNLAWIISNEPNGDLGEAQRLAHIAQEQLPLDPDVNDTLGWVYYKKKAYSLAVSRFQLAVNAAQHNESFLKHLEQAQHAHNKENASR